MKDALAADGNGQILNPQATGVTAATSVEE
jgi:hypothetical protein